MGLHLSLHVLGLGGRKLTIFDTGLATRTTELEPSVYKTPWVHGDSAALGIHYKITNPGLICPHLECIYSGTLLPLEKKGFDI